ncbi:hypothetical protein Tco_1395546, partial [Tanacetum coccineum]
MLPMLKGDSYVASPSALPSRNWSDFSIFIAAVVTGDAGRRVESKAKLEANRKRHLE